MRIDMTLNGEAVSVDAEPHEFLTEVIRETGLIGTKRGCESGDCGACSVIMDGVEVPSCMILAAQASGHEITTIEGIGTFRDPHPIQQAFVDCTAVQCGFCTPGMVVATKACLDAKKRGLDANEARELLAGHVCRCTGYTKPIEAVVKSTAACAGGQK